MAYKTPPVRAAFFDAEVGMPTGDKRSVDFVRTTKEWAQWAALVALALGYSLETLTATASLDFPAVAANGGTQDLTVTVTGVKAADVAPVVTIGLPSGINAGLVFHGFVSADDTVTVRCTNCTAGNINPASFTARIEVTRY